MRVGGCCLQIAREENLTLARLCDKYWGEKINWEKKCEVEKNRGKIWRGKNLEARIDTWVI